MKFYNNKKEVFNFKLNAIISNISNKIFEAADNNLNHNTDNDIIDTDCYTITNAEQKETKLEFEERPDKEEFWSNLENDAREIINMNQQR